MDMYDLLGKKSPKTMALELAQKFKQCRKQKKITQKELARKSNIKYGTIRHFEETGIISLSSLLCLAETLDMIEDFELLFIPSKHRNLRELINENK